MTGWDQPQNFSSASTDHIEAAEVNELQVIGMQKVEKAYFTCHNT